MTDKATRMATLQSNAGQDFLLPHHIDRMHTNRTIDDPVHDRQHARLLVDSQFGGGVLEGTDGGTCFVVGFVFGA